MAALGWVAIGGAAGACARYLVGNLAVRLGEHFPFGTLIVNVTGSLLLGLIAGLTVEGLTPSEPLRLTVAVGFLGAFTTFSTYAVDTVMLGERGATGLLLLNVLANNGLALLAAVAGLAAGRAMA